ncbi:MAG TPA: hypothetical protein VI336_03035 [Candidatus Saccharimonadales bacterium]|nr:hypothetical protein [Candidatus Saccharimonadales bacterium]
MNNTNKNHHKIPHPYQAVAGQITELENKWRGWHYKNTTLLLLSLAVFIYLARTPSVDNLIRQIGDLGYVGAFFAGVLFVSTFTVAPAAVVLYHLAGSLHPVEIALIAGLGAMIGDYIIFRFIKDKIFSELRPLFLKFGGSYLKIVYKSPYFAWVLPLSGAFIIASPFPDEMGVSMLGLSKIKRWQFFAVTLLLNAVGIFLVVSAARLL